MVAIIDLDEFIVPVHADTVIEDLEQLPVYVSLVMIGWVRYGSSGHEKKQTGLVL